MTNISIIVGREAVKEHYNHGFLKFIKRGNRGYFYSDLMNWYDRANAYICAEEYAEYEFPDGQYQNGHTAYSDFAGMVPVSCICLYLQEDDTYSLSFIETNTKYIDKGYSKIVIAAMIKWLKDNNITKLHRTNATDDGEKYTFNNITNALNNAGISFTIGKM